MKKLLLALTLFFPIVVSASVTTYERTEEDLRVSKFLYHLDKEAILSTPSVNAEEKVYDFADLLTEEEEEKLKEDIDNYIEKTNLDFAFVTIDENNKTPRKYADDFYDYNDFGIGSKNSGILFLIDMDNREIYMATTGEAIHKYTDRKINLLLDNVYQYMTKKEYYKGTKLFIEAAITLENMQINNGSYIVHPDGRIEKSIPWILIFGFATIATFITVLIMVQLNKLVSKATSSKEYLVKDTLVVNRIKDMLVNTYTSKVKIQSSSSGGSSTHRGSSGISHGGGGHRF